MERKEAIEVIKKIWPDSSSTIVREALETLIPEFAELEDERMKKQVVYAIKQLHVCECTKNRLLTWLEKQAQKPAWTEEDKNMLEWVIGYLENKMLNTPISEERIACKNAIAWFKKLEGEQKPNPCDGCVNRKGCINCENGELRETEHKPTDKVEPKFHEGDIIIHKELGGDYIHNPHKIIQVDILDKKYRLEGGLVAHFGEQEDYELVEQKQEWSESDKEMHAAVLQLITDSEKENGWNCVYCNDKEIYFSDIIAWLKSLRPQSHWKPSDEQLKSLKEVIDVGHFTSYPNALETLYEQLKKLRDE